MFDKGEFKQILYDINSKMGNYFFKYRICKKDEIDDIISKRSPPVKMTIKNVAPMIVIENKKKRPYNLVVDEDVFRLYSRNYVEGILVGMAAEVKLHDLGYEEVLWKAQTLIDHRNVGLLSNEGFKSFRMVYMNGVHSVMCDQITFDYGFMKQVYTHRMGALGITKVTPSWQNILEASNIEYSPLNDLVNMLNISHGSSAFRIAKHKTEAESIDDLTKEILMNKLSDKSYISRYERFRDSFCVDKSVTPMEIENNFFYILNF